MRMHRKTERYEPEFADTGPRKYFPREIALSRKLVCFLLLGSARNFEEQGMVKKLYGFSVTHYVNYMWFNIRGCNMTILFEELAACRSKAETDRRFIPWPILRTSNVYSGLHRIRRSAGARCGRYIG